MIKGVNKKIIEVKNPDSIYFEKAVFYLRPHILELPEEVSRQEISCYIAQIGLDDYKRKRRIRPFLLIAGAIAFAAVSLMLLNMIV